MELINKEIRIETTNFCNANCVMCPRDEMTRPKVTMEYRHFCYLVAQAHEMGATLISPFGFGEPLMDPDIVEKVAFCSKIGLDTFITTNASLLNWEMTRELLDVGLTHIRFSAHGIYDNYEKVHKGLSFDTFKRNVFNFINVRRSLPCKIDVTVMPMNGESVQDILDFWEGRIDDIEIWKPHNWGPKEHYRNGERKLKTCGRPKVGPVQIQADGKMIPCCFLTDGEIILGDTYVDSIEDILKGEKYRELRRKHEAGDLEELPCETCDQLMVQETSPLLYSTINSEINRTSSTKFNLLEEQNGININREI